MVISAALVAAVSTGVLMWDWARTASGDNPKASVRLLSPGILSIALESGNTDGAGLALEGDGTMVVGATTWVPASDKNLGVVVRLPANGRLAHPAVTLLADAETIVSAVAMAPGGTIVVAGYGSSGFPASHRHFRLARLQPDGGLDPTFGHHGLTRANMRSSIWLGDAARALALQDDGRIVVTGSAGYALGPLSQAAYCATARFNHDGRLDGSFGPNGRVLTLLPGQTSCGGVAVLVAPDRGIIVAGNAFTDRVGGAHHIAVLRYLPSGAPDPRFGRDGTAELDMEATAWGAALDSQGRIVVVGTEWRSLTSTRLLVARFDSQGNVDQSFGANGTVSLHEADVSQDLVAAALQQDGKIVAVGTSGWHSGTRAPEPGKRDQIAVVRLDPNGALDTSFAGGGLLLLASSQYLWGGHGIAIQPDGKLLIVGNVVEAADDGPPSRPAIVLVRLRPDGTPDPDFGSGVPTP